MANRAQRAAIAAETLEICEQGRYAVDGRAVSIADDLARMRDGTRLYTPREIGDVLERTEPSPATGIGSTKFRVANCTTFAAARALAQETGVEVLCLNFASAKNPGGGFLSGSQAQEEALTRASGLYASLTQDKCRAYYEINRAHRSCLYTDHAIYSPSVPVFRDDADTLLGEPYLVSILTMPAVNAGAVRNNEPGCIDQTQPTMERRIRSVLGLARRHGHRILVLGAWGCGVFRNDPRQVARWFDEALTKDSAHAGAFDEVFFAVLDFARDTPTFEAFREVFRST